MARAGSPENHFDHHSPPASFPPPRQPAPVSAVLLNPGIRSPSRPRHTRLLLLGRTHSQLHPVTPGLRRDAPRSIRGGETPTGVDRTLRRPHKRPTCLGGGGKRSSVRMEQEACTRTAGGPKSDPGGAPDMNRRILQEVHVPRARDPCLDTAPRRPVSLTLPRSKDPVRSCHGVINSPVVGRTRYHRQPAKKRSTILRCFGVRTGGPAPRGL